MHVSIGRLPAAVVCALGGVDQGGGVYDVSPAVTALCRAFGGVASGGGGGSRILREDLGFILREDGTKFLRE